MPPTLRPRPSRVSPFTIAMMISNMASGLVSMEYDLRGPNMSIVTMCDRQSFDRRGLADDQVR